MPIQTTPLSVLTITAAEVARVNSETNSLIAARAEAVVEIARLNALLAAVPPVVVPPVVVPPVTGRTRLFVDGNKLKTKNGTPVQLRSIELMYTDDAHNLGAVGVCSLALALGSNAIGPLFADSHGDLSKVRALCDAARTKGLIVGVNADHQRTEGGRAWLCQPGMVTLLNGYDHVFLQCEVETDEVEGAADWIAGVNSLVRDLRAAGHKSVIKVGAPQGGRRIEFPLAKCQEVLAADPEKQLVFSAQMYWGEASSSNWYQSQAGVAGGLAGTKAALAKLAASPCCFVAGFDWQDDIGTTGELALIDEADRLGLSFQHWVLTGDGSLALNNLIDRFDWSMSIDSITASGRAIQQKLLAKRALAAL